MNLFVDSLAEYLAGEWDRVLSESDGPREARFIIQSLSPVNTFDLFATLEEHRVAWSKHSRIECHFKVAAGLWNDWRQEYSQADLDQELAAHGAPGAGDELGWIDLDDHLTWYRNRTRSPEMEGLVVVLLGLNHASDQGGLANFHVVDEGRLWQRMETGFAPWIERINSDFGLSASQTEIERFDSVLQDLFLTRPRQLERLSGFLQNEVIADGQDLYALSDVVNRFYAKLPFWEIPPFFDVQPSRKSTGLLKDAATFISHQRFKTTFEQKKAWKKIQEALDEDRLDLPATLDNLPLYDSPKAFSETLYAFIHEADTKARERLLQTDLGPVLRLLKAKTNEGKGGTPKKPFNLNGQSLDAFLQAIWLTLLEFQKRRGSSALAETLKSVRIELVAFRHDLQADEDAGLGKEFLAKELLQGCLGGIVEVLDRIEWRLPIDGDQVGAARDDWERVIPICMDMNLDELAYGVSRGRPHLHFKVILETEEGEGDMTRPFHWSIGPNQPERVRRLCAKTVLERWDEAGNPHRILPAFRIPSVVMTALYYAADEDEANRLVSQALNELSLVDLLDGVSQDLFDPLLWRAVLTLSGAYRNLLKRYLEQGYYHAITHDFLPVLQAYLALAEQVLDPTLCGSSELLRRLYKAFLLVDEEMAENDGFLRSAIVFGISPSVLELTFARQRFLCDGFPEAAAELALGHDGKSAFNQLLKLAEIHRPLAGLVVDQTGRLSAEIKSFGLLHHLGPERDGEKSLAVQTLLREEESDDDDNVSEITRPTEESEVVVRVLEDYRQLYPFAEDGMRILALHVEELGTVLSGVDRFLRAYLKSTPRDWPAFHCEVMVYSTSSSPMAMESRLSAWRHQLAEAHRESGRPLVLSVGHRFAPDRGRMVDLLAQERRLYDIAFLFHFLEGDLTGKAEPALPFQFDFNASNIGQFPICEYPRPIQAGDPWRRQSLLSNRRLQIQTRHADLSARLRNDLNPHKDHLIFGQIDYSPWQEVVEALHAKAQWVACIDPFVDKRLLRTGEGDERRKIVGFTSGLGDYGELNLSISTQQDTLAQLAGLVRGQLAGLMPYQDDVALDGMAAKVVNEAEEVIGLSALRAVVGDSERVREVVGFAAIRRALAVPTAAMSQLLPVDSLLHWFAGSDVTHRPDLLQLSLIPRENDLPLLHAVVIECKFAQQNPAHLIKASDQVQEGLSHLMPLLAPNRDDLRRVSFDRRYWWAQLQRAVTSRAVVQLSEIEWRKLDRALENLAEGYYEMSWQGAIFTFWTNEPGPEPVLTPMALPPGVVAAPFTVPNDFAVWHVALGHEGLTALFAEDAPQGSVALGEQRIAIRSTVRRADEEAELAEARTDVARGDAEDRPSVESEGTSALLPAAEGADTSATDTPIRAVRRTAITPASRDADSRAVLSGESPVRASGTSPERETPTTTAERSDDGETVPDTSSGVVRRIMRWPLFGRKTSEGETEPAPTSDPRIAKESGRGHVVRRMEPLKPAVKVPPVDTVRYGRDATVPVHGASNDGGWDPERMVATPPGEGSPARAGPAVMSNQAAPGAPVKVDPIVKCPPPAADPVPEKILIGTKSNGEPVYWHYGDKRLQNRHLLAFGASGSGKTYGIQCLLAEMAAQGLRSLIVDYTDGFLPNQVEERFTAIAKPRNHYVFTEKLPLNPFRRQRQVIDPALPAVDEKPYDVATRVSSIFTSVFETMGDQQQSALVRVIDAGITASSTFSLPKLLDGLRSDGQYGESLANKLEPLIKSEPFREGADSAWAEMLASPDAWVHVLQLKGLARDIQRLVTEFTLWDLYDYATSTGSQYRPIPVVLDEIQNLDHRSDSPIDKMLREGRKFGLSLILATQTTSQFNQEQRDRLFQAGHKLFFKPADTEIDRFATLLNQATGESKAEWSQRLAKLNKGQCWSLGGVLTSGGTLQTKPILVNVTTLEERGLGGALELPPYSLA
ncbi:type IV secretion system DNA-binding domain-containing protein [Thiocapsa rosea]|uniref:AAA domain-containing protein n=1 Tax=Thiocapsa rosea TaxID=69360 RepID=A0A495VB87_9GAMM|nr:type IV secretion system DNA-binding domain-containing protein [Thiocapsa rosea]RKT46609.1 AAA domain-containing protein [Thiocapsa rosea]